jgi:UDP-GlcNAc3NAcA epimerase
MKILTVIGARPQIIKAAALSRAIRTHYSSLIEEIILHTGQHYDENMSNVFFHELGIPQPDINLNIGSGSHGVQTARMTEGIEQALLSEKPDAVILYGDTNSTLSGAIAASKVHIPVIHIEAGLRSFNKNMPEEINRIVCDHCSTLLFSPTPTGLKNLLNEGFSDQTKAPFTIDHPGIFLSGDIMYDNSLYFTELAEQKNELLNHLNIANKEFILCTIHRDNNTDNPKRLNAIFKAILEITKNHQVHVVLPLHPRTAKMLPVNLDTNLYQQIQKSNQIIIIPPVSFLEMILLEKHCTLIITDSGGVQKEAYFFQKPCLILRPETEWKEIAEHKCAIITDANCQNILNAYEFYAANPPVNYPSVFGNGHAAEEMCRIILQSL